MKKSILITRPFFKVLKHLYYKLLYFKNRSFKEMIKNKRIYTKTIKKNELSGLKNVGIIKIRAFNFKLWKFNSGLDHSYRRYYTGYYNGNKCFIKIAKNDMTVFNEILVANKHYNFDFSPRIFLTDVSFNDGLFLIVQEYISGLKKMYKPKSFVVFDFWCKQFNCILDCFCNIGFVHCDIHRGNLLVEKKDSKLYLVDYGIGTFLPKNEIINFKARPGAFYSLSIESEVEKRIYDDAYAFVQVVKGLHINDKWLKKSSWYSLIESRIGQICFCVEVS